MKLIIYMCAVLFFTVSKCVDTVNYTNQVVLKIPGHYYTWDNETLSEENNIYSSLNKTSHTLTDTVKNYGMTG